MEVTLDRWRILHLILLMTASFIVAEILIKKWEWASLSAYGFAITITTQISKVINPDPNDDVEDAADKKREEKRERVLEKRRERRKGETGVAGKKKK